LGANPFVWVFHAAGRGFVRCRVLQFDSVETAATIERQIALAIDRGGSIDELSTRAGMIPFATDEGTFNDVDLAIEFLASKADVVLCAKARRLLSKMHLV
jgi:hypothetical protein